jgi:hypothetical protein
VNAVHEQNWHDDYGSWQVMAFSISVILLCVLSLQAVVDVWQMFQTEFVQLWDEHSHKGDAYPAALFGGSVQQGHQAHQACVLAFTCFLQYLSFFTLLLSRMICDHVCLPSHASFNTSHSSHFFLAAWSVVMCASLQNAPFNNPRSSHFLLAAWSVVMCACLHMLLSTPLILHTSS